MTTTLANDPVHPSITNRRATWALWGTAAGFLGFVTNMPLAQTISDEARKAGDASATIEALSRPMFHVAAITGFLSIACLLFFAAGFARWGKAQASDSLALRVAPAAITASAGALIAAYGVKGMLAIYLPGGFNDVSYGESSQQIFFLFDDLAGYYGWWGVTIAAGCIAYLALRERLIARWIGVLGTLVVVAPLGFLVVFGFTGFSGIVAPIFLLIAATGMSRMRA